MESTTTRDSPMSSTRTNDFLLHHSEDLNTGLPQHRPDSKQQQLEEVTPQSFRANSALNALSMCPQQPQWVVLAGREVLKVINVPEDPFEPIEERVNLRSGVRVNINFSSNDVKWGNAYAKNTIVTAATNGSIVVWNLNRTSAQKIDRIITEHTRAVNRVVFHPTEPMILLSASQDGTMKLWDLRTKSTARHTFDGKAEAVRDIKFSPINGYEFASAFENGTLQKWDLRNSGQFERKWSAHNGLALSLDWHPDGRVIASGGRDKLIKFWDIKTDSRKPFHSIQTMASVAHMEWRPGHETQLASCSLSLDNRIQIFDLCRPFIPLSLLDYHEDAVTEFLWKDSDTVYSCSKDCLFLVNRVKRMGHSPLKVLNDSTVAWTPKGDLFFANWSTSSLTSKKSGDLLEEEDVHVGGENTASASSMTTSSNNRRTVSILNRWDDKTPIDIPTVKTNQILTTLDSETFEWEDFAEFASRYVVDSSDVTGSCGQNAAIAGEMGYDETFKMWKILERLFTEPNEIRNLTSIMARCFASPDVNNVEDDDEEQDSDIEREEDEKDASQELLEAKDLESSLLSEQSVRKKKDVVVQRLEGVKFVLDFLEYYSQLGNPQMCCTLALIFQNHITIPQKRFEHWLDSYITLLLRLQEYNSASKLIQASKLGRIRAMNQDSTFYPVSCSGCKKAKDVGGKSVHCEHCHSPLNLCALCRKPVKQVLIWCHICGHGGHLECLESWFETENECPTGCGHMCGRSTIDM